MLSEREYMWARQGHAWTGKDACKLGGVKGLMPEVHPLHTGAQRRNGPFCLGAAIRQDDTDEVTSHLFFFFSQRMSRFLLDDGVGNTGLRRDKSWARTQQWNSRIHQGIWKALDSAKANRIRRCREKQPWRETWGKVTEGLVGQPKKSGCCSGGKWEPWKSFKTTKTHNQIFVIGRLTWKQYWRRAGGVDTRRHFTLLLKIFQEIKIKSTLLFTAQKGPSCFSVPSCATALSGEYSQSHMALCQLRKHGKFFYLRTFAPAVFFFLECLSLALPVTLPSQRGSLSFNLTSFKGTRCPSYLFNVL